MLWWEHSSLNEKAQRKTKNAPMGTTALNWAHHFNTKHKHDQLGLISAKLGAQGKKLLPTFEKLFRGSLILTKIKQRLGVL